MTAGALLLGAASGCGDFRAFDWTPLDRLPRFAPTASKLEAVELKPAAPDDKYVPLPGRGRQYRWTTEGPVREGLRLVVYESPQRGWQVRDGFWDRRTLSVFLGAPTMKVRQIAEIESYTLFLTNLGQLIAFDHESTHFCRRAISSARDAALSLYRESLSRDSRQAQLIVQRQMRADQYYKVDMGWLCERGALMK